MKTVNLDCSKIDKTAIFHGAKGKYVDLILFDKPDQYGNDGFVVQSISKERRDAGERGPIVGNWKDTEKREAPQAGRYENVASVHGAADGGDDIPF
jgi:hypothetical protein